MTDQTTVHPSITPQFLKEQGCSPTLIERYLKRVDKSGGDNACWTWPGFIDPRGYGSIAGGPKKAPMRVHVLSWWIHFGLIPAGMQVLHKCPKKHNAGCSNPKHLKLGTQAENMRDSVRNGTARNVKLAPHVEEIKKLHSEGWTQWDIADKFGVSQAAIWCVLRGHHYKPEGEGYYSHAPE